VPKIESGLRGVVWLGNAALIFNFITAWFQVPLSAWLHFGSPFSFHLSLSVAAILLSLFANLCILFYFIGTSVWLRDRAREVFQRNKSIGLEMWPIYERANKLKGLAFPFPTLAIVLALFTFILGGAHQVGAVPTWVHPTLAFFLTLFSCLGGYFSEKGIRRNLPLLDEASAKIEVAEKEI